ncbi:MAG TPA: pentapeptide repeat-containing protein [Nostocaceae cyanobacterium]|nr:pentapeptide repeat-containing protein [Nostocaceae cyanobacterium]
MELSIRRWLLDRYQAIDIIKDFTKGQMAGVAFRILQDMEAQAGIPFEVCPLAEVLEISLGAVWEEITILAQLTEYLLCGLSQKKPLKRNEGTWLAFQIAYLQALYQVLNQEASLMKPWLDRAMFPSSSALVNQEVGKSSIKAAQLQSLLKNIRPGKLTDTQAQQALSLVADSLLVQQMNHATIAWLIVNGAEEPEAKLLTQRLVNSLPGHLLVVIANHAPPLAQLQKFVRLGNLLPATPSTEVVGLKVANSTVGDKIDLNREYYRATLLQNLSIPLFMESFALKDIYVPLSGLPTQSSKTQLGEDSPQTVDLIAWATQQLYKLDCIGVIESAAGYGKTSFYQMWAAQVARELYPNWMPVLISLRNIRYGSSFLSTLKSALPENLHPNFINWLEQDYPRCLLLLDGLDELPPVGQVSREKRIFIQNLLKFVGESKHKVFLTARLKTLNEVAPELIPKSHVITIQPLDIDQLRQWFQQWSVVQSLTVAQSFFTFLKQAGLFTNKSRLSHLSSLVHQPLMLYLFGVLHRDGLLDRELLDLAADYEQVNTTSLLWEIYYRLSRWLLGYPNFDGVKTMLLKAGTAHINRTPEAIANLLAGHHPQDVLTQMQAVALKILHSDRQQITLPPEPHSPILPKFYFRSRRQEAGGRRQEAGGRGQEAGGRGQGAGSRGEINSFYSAPSTAQYITIEFTHPKLGEYFCAQAIIAQLQALTKSQKDAYGKYIFIVDHSQLAQQIYNLLGYGILTSDIENLVIEGLKQAKKLEFSLTDLFERLESFWRDYCQGRWLDQGIAHQAVTYFHSLENPINVERVNAAVGLNIFSLLCAIAKIAEVIFWPCGYPINAANFHPTALIELINRTTILHKYAFINCTRNQTLAGLNLSGASLLQVMLAEANLESINLSEAELIGANLTGTNLQKANLIGANLTGANLTGANLQKANLTGANLTSANLTSANLTDANLNSVNLTQACLFESILDEDDKEYAAEHGALFLKDERTTFSTILTQETTIANEDQELESPDEETQIWISSTSDTIKIETAEGVPSLPYDDDEYAQAETIIGE